MVNIDEIAEKIGFIKKRKIDEISFFVAQKSDKRTKIKEFLQSTKDDIIITPTMNSPYEDLNISDRSESLLDDIAEATAKYNLDIWNYCNKYKKNQETGRTIFKPIAILREKGQIILISDKNLKCRIKDDM